MSEKLRFSWNAVQLQGMRERQEDAYAARRLDDEEFYALVLAIGDGLGGHPDGDRASRIAVDVAADHFDQSLAGRPSMPPTDEQWRAIFATCHSSLRTLVRYSRGNRPSSTLVAVAVAPTGDYSLASIGDSSAWLVSSAGVSRLCGEYGSGSWMPYCLGTDIGDSGGDGISTMAGRLSPGSKLVLATDGIESVPEPEIERLLQLPMDQAIAELSLAVVAAGHEYQDNVTVLILEASE